MGGKSTYMRQNALIVLLAHIGSYVPAKEANLSIIDRIFTRIGSADDLSRGKSTFMIEMTETANILRNATPNSLILMDEVGRGTSTFDGLSLASACIEFLAKLKAYTLFSTHYFELTALEKKNQFIKNVHLSAVESGNQIAFLHNVLNGPTNQSYGLAVAKLAGIPHEVILNAKQYLLNLEQKNNTEINMKIQQELFVQNQDYIYNKLQNLDLDKLSPKDALDLLYTWKKEYV